MLKSKAWLSVIPAVLLSTPVLAEGFLAFPLRCGDPECKFKYSEGAYTPGAINSVLDHSMKQQSNGNWPYGKEDGADGTVLGFTGDTANGPRKSDDPTCISGTINLSVNPRSINPAPLTNNRGCGAGFASYDEHPGYDYLASIGTEVRTSAAGTVISRGDDERCIKVGISDCDRWGYIGIDHGNGYVTQYGHLREIYVKAGVRVVKGQVIGLSGDKGVKGHPHLHFEVLYKLESSDPVIVDPYGWVSADLKDALYSASQVTPRTLWEHGCHVFTSPSSIPSGYGVPWNVFNPPETLLKAFCTSSGASVVAGSPRRNTTYVYKNGYYWSGSAWVPFSYQGVGLINDAWYPGAAMANVPQVGDITNFVAYTCEWTGTAWKCGCRDSGCAQSLWQLQQFRRQ